MKKLQYFSLLAGLLAWSGGLGAAEVDWFNILKRQDMHDLYDQYMNVRRQQNEVIGFNAWYKPVKMRASFSRQAVEKSAVLTLVLDGKTVDFKAVKSGNYWQPHCMYGEVSGGGVTVKQQVALLDDRVGWLVKAQGLKGKKGQWLLNLKGMNQGQGRADGNTVVFKFDREDWLKGYTQIYAMTLPAAEAEFKDIKVKPYRMGYGKKVMIDTESRAFITVPVDGAKDTFEFFLVTSVTKDDPAEAGKLAKIIAAPEKFFAQRRAEWAEFFRKDMPVLETDSKRLLQFYAWSYYAMKADTYYDAKGKPYYIAPSKEGDWLPFAWDEDSAHIVTGARWLNSADQLEMAERMIFHFMRPRSPLSFGLLTIAGWEMYLRTGDKNFLQKFYNAVKNNRKNYKRYMKGPLVIQDNSFLIGWDKSLRYAWGGFNKNMRKFERPVLPVDLNSYLVREYEILALAADILGHKSESGQWRKLAAEVAGEINRLMWDEKSGFYYDIFADDHSKLMCKAASGFTPLLAGVATKAQAEKVLTHLKDPKEFGTRYAVPTLAVSEPKRARNWSGDVAGRNNYIVEQGIARYDRESSAWITHKTMDLFMRPEGGCASGYLRPERIVKNYSLFITEMAGGLDMMIRHVIGFTPEVDGFSLLPAALDEKTAYLRWQIDYRGHKVEIRYDRPDGKDMFDDMQEGYTALVDDCVVYHNPQLPLERKYIKSKVLK